MARITITIGVILMLLGMGTYLGGGQKSVTALIPAFFGLPLTLLGLAALKDTWRKHAMHAAAGLALLGFVGALARPVHKTLAGEPPALSLALASQLLMAILCATLVILAVKSFVDARRRRQSPLSA
ncbi:MAG: hypothetical protein ABFD16_26940 [Thermoguttaceae bacterium]|jgi:uncharacterized membrane protein